MGVAAAAVIALGGVGVGAYVANQNDPLNQVLQAQDVRQATVDVSGGGTATVSISSSKDAVVVKMNNVPAPPAGKVFQMWLIPKDGSAPVSQGLMDAEALSKPAVVKGIGRLQRWASPLNRLAAPLRPRYRQLPLPLSERRRRGNGIITGPHHHRPAGPAFPARTGRPRHLQQSRAGPCSLPFGGARPARRCGSREPRSC